MNTSGKCELCGLERELTKHHLVPKVKCHNKYKKIENDESNFIWICRQCHDYIHAAYSENELRDNYSTLEKLKSSDKIQTFIKWQRNHPNDKSHSKMSNRRK